MRITLPHLVELISQIRIIESPDAYDALLQELAAHAKSGKAPLRIGFINAHAVNLCQDNPEFYQNLKACELLLRDGSGMKLLYKWQQKASGLNMNGTDFIPVLLAACSNRSVVLLGTEEPYLSHAASQIEAAGLTIAHQQEGFAPAGEYVATLNQHPADITVLAMGMPKQEAVAALLASDATSATRLIICGGAVLDFMGGKVTRAPAIFRKMGMEWLYRLLQEPTRLAKRYLYGNARFLITALRLARLNRKEEA